MQSRVESILRNINRKDRSYNILTFATHESFQTNLSKIPNCNWFLYQGEGIKTWNNAYRQLPKNHILLNGKKDEQIKSDIVFDAVLSQNKAAHWNISKRYSEILNIPLISLEHCLPFVGWNHKQIKVMSELKGDINVFISEYSMKEWGFLENENNIVIHHGIDTEIFKRKEEIPKENYVLAVCNDIKNRQWCCGYNEWCQLVNGFSNKILGSNPGLSEPAKSTEDLINHYNSAICFVNSSLVSPIPLSVLEALSCELPVITLSNCCLPEIIIDGHNGFISNDINYLREKTKYLLDNPKAAIEMGKNARQTILKSFSNKEFCNKWESVIKKLIK